MLKRVEMVCIRKEFTTLFYYYLLLFIIIIIMSATLLLNQRCTSAGGLTVGVCVWLQIADLRQQLRDRSPSRKEGTPDRKVCLLSFLLTLPAS